MYRDPRRFATIPSSPAPRAASTIRASSARFAAALARENDSGAGAFATIASRSSRLSSRGALRRSRPSTHSRSNVTYPSFASLLSPASHACNAWNDGLPASSTTHASPSITASRTGSLRTASATIGNFAVQSWPPRVTRRTSSPAFAARSR